MNKLDKGFVRAWYRGVPAYFNLENNVLIGRNWLYDKLIDFNVWLDFSVLGVQELPILIEKDE